MPNLLLLGGSSSIGKTTVARDLAQRLGWELISADKSLPKGPVLDPLASPLELWDRPAAQLCELLVAAAHAATPLLKEQLAARAGSAPGIVLEGERIAPTLLAQVAREHNARGVFVVESDAQRLHDTLTARSRSFGTLSESRRRTVAEVDRLYGQWLTGECARLQLPCVPSQPWESLADRVLGGV